MPRKYSEETKNEVISFANQFNAKEASKAYRISYPTVRKWLKDDESKIKTPNITFYQENQHDHEFYISNFVIFFEIF